jgi:phosphopantetheinyl transferase
MILLTCAALPREISSDTLYSLLSLLFPHRENEDYFKAIVRRKNSSSVNESLFALVLLYELLTRLPAPPETASLRLMRTDDGKPYFKDSYLHFSISHSHGYAVCALSDEDEVGVDAEASDVLPEKAKKIADRYFGDGEKALVNATTDAFKKIWCEKEARAKCLGLGLGKLLEIEKKTSKDSDFCKDSDKLSVHRFYFDKIPICLCAKGKNQTIQFISVNEMQ